MEVPARVTDAGAGSKTCGNGWSPLAVWIPSTIHLTCPDLTTVMLRKLTHATDIRTYARRLGGVLMRPIPEATSVAFEFDQG
jgi:hypothetical protein